MGISVLIIEDSSEENARVKQLIEQQVKEIQTISQVHSIQELSAVLSAHTFDIMLVDIHLHDGNTLNFLKRQSSLRSIIIFTTSHDKYAIEAFKLSAVQYLLKPYDDSELIYALHKAIQSIEQENYYKQLETLFYNASPSVPSRRIVLKNHDLVHVVHLNEIMYAQADNNYSLFFCINDRKILVSKSLKSFEEQLANYQFFRCHNSYLVNLQKIKAFNKGEDTIILQDESNIPLASSRKKLLFQILR